MQRLVGQILDFSKIQNSKMKLRVQYVDIISFTKEIINYFTALSQERHISLNFNTQLSKVNLWVDKDKLEKIILICCLMPSNTLLMARTFGLV